MSLTNDLCCICLELKGNEIKTSDRFYSRSFSSRTLSVSFLSKVVPKLEFVSLRSGSAHWAGNTDPNVFFCEKGLLHCCSVCRLQQKIVHLSFSRVWKPFSATEKNTSIHNSKFQDIFLKFRLINSKVRLTNSKF